MLEVVRLLCPYPTINADGGIRDGLLLAQPRICQRCSDRECRSYLTKSQTANLGHAVCPKGMSVVSCDFPEGRVTCIGVILKMVNSQCPPEVRKQYQTHKVGWVEISAWHASVARVIPEVESAAARKAQEAVDGLHDVKTAVSLVTRNAEAIITTLQGTSDEDKIENASPELKGLLKSVQLLHTRLSASSILANPDAASYGQKHPMPIHKVCFKMARLFEELAARTRVRVRMSGTSYATPYCHDSFETIPLVLIDNAVKYSEEGEYVTVSVNDAADHTMLKVESHGSIVPASMRESIFQRGVRGPDSSKLVSRGSGLGLYIASIVAKAHGMELKYECVSVDRNGKTGKNVFSCRIPSR